MHRVLAGSPGRSAEAARRAPVAAVDPLTEKRLHEGDVELNGRLSVVAAAPLGASFHATFDFYFVGCKNFFTGEP